MSWPPPRRRVTRLWKPFGAAAALAASLSLLGSQPSAQSTSPVRTVFVIVFENYDWSQVKGNSSAPYINNTLLPQASRAEQYTTPPGLHPSTPNYWWMEAGQDFGLRGLSDYTPAKFPLTSTSHLVNQLEAAGISWKTYHEDIDGRSCPLTDQGLYTVHHNPFVFFTDVTNNGDTASARCIAHVRPYSELATDLAANTVARYNYIIPNLCNDMHDCGIAAGDTWLENNLPAILNSPAYLDGGAVFITWDEGAGATSDGPIGMMVLSSAGKGNGYANTIPYTHSSFLLTMQEIFDVRPLLGDAPNATDLSDLFASFPAVTPSTPTPATSATGVSLSIRLKWSSSGSSDAVHFGTVNPPPLVATGVASHSYLPASLAPTTTYYWQVTSTSSSGGTVPGPIWSFTTGTTSSSSSQWSNIDVGAVGVTGSTTYGTSDFTVKGAGADIWGTADAFQYVYQPLEGDGTIVARVTALQNTNTYAKAGVMIRESLSAGSAHVILDIRPGGGVEFMQRAVSGGTTTYLGGTTLPFPAWLRLDRTGSTVTASVSGDGVTWTTIGSATTSMGSSTLAGMPVTSHTATALTTATFDNVSLTAAGSSPPPSLPSAPGSPSPADGASGVTSSASLTWTAPNATSYDVAFGTANPPPIVAPDLATASYTPPGMTAGTKYYWQVIARNASGSMSGAIWSFTTEPAAPPPVPAVPATPAPADGATGVATNATLSWAGSNATSYDVAFGTANPPSVVAPNLATASYTPPGMTAGTKYYWQVIARSASGSTPGAVWSFTTAPAAPPPAPAGPTTPSPANGATGVATNATLSWTASNATSYDVAFGTTNPPPRAATNLTTSSYAPPGMVASTKYYWQVIARNASGSTAGPVWTFTTSNRGRKR